jgi:hypothetical protein
MRVTSLSKGQGRRTTGIIAALLAPIIIVAMPVPTSHADHCEVIGCWRECRPVPGGRWCRNVCQRRCWREPAPRYHLPSYAPGPDREPEYTTPSPQYATPSHVRGSPGLDPLARLLALGGIGVIAVLIIAAIASVRSATDDVSSTTEETQRETAATEALIAKLEAAAREADRHLDRFLAGPQHPPR